MKGLLEQYGVGIFTLVMMAILIAIAGPFGIRIREYLLPQLEHTNQIGSEEIEKVTNGIVRPEEPTETANSVWAYIDENKELVISQYKIEDPNALVGPIKTNKPSSIDTTPKKQQILTARIEGAVKPKSCYRWFYNCQNLTEIKNIENLYTNKCISMGCMFYNCNKLKTLNLIIFDTSNVTDMTSMFDSCNGLTTLDVSKFNTSNVTTMSYMFNNCNGLITLDVSKFDTSNVTNMSNMFNNCNGLTTLDVSKFDTSNVTTMSNMFNNCNNLTGLDVSKFDTSNVTDMTSMFDSCNGLTTLNHTFLNIIYF